MREGSSRRVLHLGPPELAHSAAKFSAKLQSHIERSHHLLFAIVATPPATVTLIQVRRSLFVSKGLQMPRRLSSSQIRSEIRQAQTRRRQTVQKLNSAIRTHNNKVRKYNADRRRAIDAHNREVRSHNARVRANRSRLRSALQRLSAQTTTIRYRSFHASVADLYSAYERLDKSNADPFLKDLAERDTANSVTVLNALLGDSSQIRVGDGRLADTRLEELLSKYPTEIHDRWSGAIFALNPGNPDAARHFCTSAREILADILNTEAPDAKVFSKFPNCQLTDQGTPTRRAKIHYCLDRSGLNNGDLEDFIERNIKDLSILFKDLNTGSHGPAGRFSLPQLTAIKIRVEDAIEFICQIVY